MNDECDTAFNKSRTFCPFLAINPLFSHTHTHTIYTHVAQVTKSSKDRWFGLNHDQSMEGCLLSIVKKDD